MQNIPLFYKIILFILLFFIIYYSVFKIINYEKYSKSKKHKKIIAVVSRYNEDLKWINTDPFNKFKYIVYNKGPNDNFDKTNVIKIIKLENVGRESHTYLYHICNNYDNLDDITIFLPGSIDAFQKKVVAKDMLESIDKYHKAFLLCQPINNILKKMEYNFKINQYKCTNKQNYSLNNTIKIGKSKIRPFGKWYCKHINNKFNLDNLSFNCIISVDKRDILNHPKKFYHNLLNEVNSYSNPETGHYLERSWSNLFKLKFTIIKNDIFLQHLIIYIYQLLNKMKIYYNSEICQWSLFRKIM